MCLLAMSEVTPVVSQQADCLNRSRTKMASIDMPKWTGRASEASALYKELQTIKEYQEHSLPQGRAQQLIIQ